MIGSESRAAYKALAHYDRCLSHERRRKCEVRRKNRSQHMRNHDDANGRAQGQAARRTSLTLIRLHMGVGSSVGHKLL